MVVIQSKNHKHLGMILDTKLEFQEHLKDKLSKISKTIGLLELHCLQYIRHLLDVILIMVTSYMIRHIIANFIKILKKFSISQHLQ